MQLLVYAAAIAAHAVLLTALVISVVIFGGNPIIQTIIIGVGAVIVAFSTWQAIKGIRDGEPLGEALCWLWD